MRVTYQGVNGRVVGLDLGKVEAVLDEGDGEVHLITASDWYKVRASINDVLRDWKAE